MWDNFGKRNARTDVIFLKSCQVQEYVIQTFWMTILCLPPHTNVCSCQKCLVISVWYVTLVISNHRYRQYWRLQNVMTRFSPYCSKNNNLILSDGSQYITQHPRACSTWFVPLSGGGGYSVFHVMSPCKSKEEVISSLKNKVACHAPATQSDARYLSHIAAAARVWTP